MRATDQLSSQSLDALRVYEPDECGRDGYPLAWHKIDGGPGVKHLIRELAEHRCVRCGHPYRKADAINGGEWSACDRICRHDGPIRWLPWDGDDWAHEDTLGPRDVRHDGIVQARWRILTVHHLCLGSDAKRDLRWWNLASLCQRCHLQIQGKVQMERVYPWPHSEWFKPYAAGWYAWSYLGEDLTRAQTLARLAELLALEGTVNAL